MKTFRISTIALLLLSLIAIPGFTQLDKQVQAIKISTPPTIDGIVDEVWQSVAAASGFVQFEPRKGENPSVNTTFRVCFDEFALYILVECADPNPANISSAITNRDGDLDDDDAVFLLLDTFNDNNSSYVFATNLLGTQRDGRVTDNGRSSDERWDGTWQCAASKNEQGWIAEFRIPLRTIRFSAGEDATWGINVIRIYPRSREVSTWAGPVESPFRVSQSGELQSLDIRAPEEKRYELIPYVIAQVRENAKSDAEVGLDARYRLKSDLTAEVTFNPDFALIEADVEQINLSRFELFVSEKRPFFQEGSELFRQRITQFYSRRIGDIPWGGKLNGRVGDWDVAAIAASSEPLGRNVEADSDEATYTVARGKRQIFKGSNVGFLVANRSWMGEDRGSVGLDTTLFFTETFGMTAQFVRAHGPENDGALAWFVRPAFDSSTTHFHLRYSNTDRNMRENMNAVGFLRDDDRKEFDTNFSHTFWMQNSVIESIRTSNNYNRYWSQSGTLRSWEYDGRNVVSFKNKWFAEVEINEEFKLFEKEFRNRRYEVEFGYDTRTGRSFSLEYGIGENFDSDIQLLEADIELKITDEWNIEYGLTRLWLDPDPEDESTWIHVLRTSYFFHKDFFFRAFLQSNSVLEKETAQVVMVWRFLPPFGALQTAYQYGSRRLGVAGDEDHALFVKFSWVL